MLPAERENARTLIYEVLPSRYGINVHHLRQADAIELTIGQGAKPGTGGLLLGSKVSPEIAQHARPAARRRSAQPCRHPDFLGPDDMIIKIEELREATDWQVPIFVKMGASRVYDDVKLAAKAGADVVVVDGMEGGTGASPDLLQEHTGIPTLAAVCEARAALEDCGLYGEVQLIIAGGIRARRDAAKALALGADAVYVGTAALIALNCNKPLYVEDYHAIGTAPYCHHCHTGRCPVGITTQDPELMKRLDIDEGAERVANLLRAMTAEIQILARACGKTDVHDLEPEDMAALTLEASAFAEFPLAGTRKVVTDLRSRVVSFLVALSSLRQSQRLRIPLWRRGKATPRARRPEEALAQIHLHQDQRGRSAKGVVVSPLAAAASGCRRVRNTVTNEVHESFFPKSHRDRTLGTSRLNSTAGRWKRARAIPLLPPCTAPGSASLPAVSNTTGRAGCCAFRASVRIA